MRASFAAVAAATADGLDWILQCYKPPVHASVALMQMAQQQMAEAQRTSQFWADRQAEIQQMDAEKDNVRTPLRMDYRGTGG